MVVSRLPSQHVPASIHIFYWGRRGGGAAYTRDLAKLCARVFDGDRCRLTLRAEVEGMPRFREVGISIETLRLPLRLASSPFAWTRGLVDVVRCFIRLRTHPPRVAIIPMNFIFAWPLVECLRCSGSHIIYVAHDARPHPGDHAAAWQRFTQARLLRAADQIVVLSEFVSRQVIEQLGPSEAHKVVRASLDTIAHPGAPGTWTRSPIAPIRMLFVGRMLAYKGLDLLAKALNLLPGELDWRLTIAGTGPLAPEVRRWFEGNPRVSLRIEWLTNDAFEHQIQTHDAVLAPYTEASQSGVVAEALRCGVPSIVTPVGGLPEQTGFGRAGVVASGSDALSFAGAVAQVLNNVSRLAELSEAARSLSQARAAETPWPALISQALAVRAVA